ncbi:MAG: hypothetical protein WB689_34440 [Xanthobacteraceae bacterium]
MSDQSAPLTPILVSTRQARELLANMCPDKFWIEAKRGKFGKRIGPPNKRYWYYENIRRYADSLAREPHSKKTA